VRQRQTHIANRDSINQIEQIDETIAYDEEIVKAHSRETIAQSGNPDGRPADAFNSIKYKFPEGLRAGRGVGEERAAKPKLRGSSARSRAERDEDIAAVFLHLRHVSRSGRGGDARLKAI